MPKRLSRSFISPAILAALAVTLGGCLFSKSEPPPPPPPCPTPEPLLLALRASDRLNPGEQGEGLATVIRVYQLKGTNKIHDLGFDDMLGKDKELLAEDLVNAEEFTLQPGQTREWSPARGPETTHVAVVALFRQPTGTSWRVVKALEPADPQHCHRKPPKRGAKPTPPLPAVFAVLDENRVELR